MVGKVWLALVVSLPMVLGSVPAHADQASPIRILIVGDSVTQGSSGDWTWRYRLWKHLVASDVPVDFVGPRDDLLERNTGEFGSHAYQDPDFDQDHAARWGMASCCQDTAIATLMAEYRPDVVIDALGINDLIWFGRSPESLAGDFDSFVTDARAADPTVAVIGVRLAQHWISGADGYNSVLGEHAAALSSPEAPVLATQAPEWTQGRDTYDPAHPTPIGEVKLAAAVADQLAELGIGAKYPRRLPTLPVVPRQPARLSVAPGVAQAQLSWTLPPGGDSVVIETREAATKPWVRTSAVAFPSTSWTAPGLVDGHAYDFRVRAKKGDLVPDDVVSNVVRVRPGVAEIQSVRPSVLGTATVTVDRLMGATRHEWWYRDVTRHQRWQANGGTVGTKRVVRGLRNRDLYEVRVRVTGGDRRSTAFSRVRFRIPPLGAVHAVRAWRRSARVIRTTGRVVPGASEYQLLLSPVTRCAAAPPTSFRWVRTTTSAPSSSIALRSRATWVRWAAARAGIRGVVANDSTTCVVLRP